MKTTKYPKLKGRYFVSELTFSATRSSGPGGQNVNKVNTRVELRFNVFLSSLLSEKEKKILRNKLKSMLTEDGELIVVSQSERTQYRNKENAIEKFNFILNKALTPRKRRVPTKPSPASGVKRLEAKRKRSEIKNLRKNIENK